MLFRTFAVYIKLDPMALFDAITYAVAELTAYVAGKATGRVFRVKPKDAQRIGEYIVIGLIASAGLIITLVYS